MKKIAMILTLAVSSFVFAQADSAAAPAEKKMSKKQAKMECLKEKADMKGKELAHCVKEKMK